MPTRSEFRHACFRAKNNALTDANRQVIKDIEPLLAPGQNWDNFSVVWDLMVRRDGSVVVIKPEVDQDFVHMTCMSASIYSKKSMPFDFNDRESNIITIVETMMLDGLMNWTDYGSRWGVEVDHELRAIRTKLYSVRSNQRDVSPAMISASMKSQPVAEPPSVQIITAVPISKEDAEAMIASGGRARPRKKQ